MTEPFSSPRLPAGETYVKSCAVVSRCTQPHVATELIEGVKAVDEDVALYPDMPRDEAVAGVLVRGVE